MSGLGSVIAPSCCAALSRRRFGRLVAGGAGLAVGATIGLPTVAQAHTVGFSTLAQAQVTGGAAPKPIPGGITVFNTFIHHYGPPSAGTDRLQRMGDQSQITDFDGIVTANRVTGTGRGTDTRTGTTRAMPFRADMGFMQGAYVGEDGQRREGTFGFVWLDIYDGPVGTNQVHDYAPPISPSGLFWLVQLPASNASADVARGTASLRVSNIAMPDTRDNEHSIVGGPSVPATASFEVEWDSPIARAALRNEAERWGGDFVETQSRVAFSARQDGFTYQSDPANTSSTVWGVVGRERSGVFFAPAAATAIQLPRALPRTGAWGELGPLGGPIGAALVAAAMLLRRRGV